MENVNNVDRQYLSLLRNILENGAEKDTRSGKVLSLFGQTMRFNLKEGFPLLTTKKVYTKGIIHELLWFISGNTNIKYLVDNNVNIWVDDAFRWFKTLDFRRVGRKENHIGEDNNIGCAEPNEINKLNYQTLNIDDDIVCSYTLSKNNDFKNEVPILINEFIETLTKDKFIDLIKDNTSLHRYDFYDGKCVSDSIIYNFGDLGEVYGKQWRSFGISNRDQLQNIIDTLKSNPDDRRMVMTAWNPDVLDCIALPACHILVQVYTRKLSKNERCEWFLKHDDNKYNDKQILSEEFLDGIKVPKRELSLSWYQRSVDCGCGLPFNIASYSLLVHMLCHICNMIPGELIFFGGDCHIYENHIKGIKEQLSRDINKYPLPKLKINSKIYDINDFKYDDIQIIDYQSYPSIKLPLNVG